MIDFQSLINLPEINFKAKGHPEMAELARYIDHMKKQLFDEYLNKYQINPKKVYIMPACQTAIECRKKEIDLIEFCKKNQFNYLQI